MNFLKKLKINLSKENKVDSLKAFIIEQAEIIKKQNEALKELKDLISENKELKKEIEELKKRLNLSPESPSCPSGAKPSFIKADSKKKGKKPGREDGHKGTSRKRPEPDEISDKKEHKLKDCPDCGYKFKKDSKPKRSRIIIDIVLPEKPDVVEHEIYSEWCPNCLEMKEEIITDALPGFSIGLQTMAYSAFKHYHLGMSISKILKEFNILGMKKISKGALIGNWQALAKFLKPFYNEIHEKIRTTEEALYADETGHRQKGQKFWLWSFSTKSEAFFAIRKRRNGNVVREILGKEFFGILITDFWKPYLAVIARFRQWCVAHYLREFKKVEFKENKSPPEYLRFKKKVKRLFKDALSFSKQKKISTENREKAHKRFIKRLDNIVEKFIDSDIKDVKRLTKRLKTYRDGFFTFVSHEGVDATNNYAERIIRYAVIMRKISFHTMSKKGSETMAILMTVFKTLELREEDPMRGMIEIVKKEIIKQKSFKIQKINSAA